MAVALLLPLLLALFFPILLMLLCSSTKQSGLPPGPRPWPALGNLPHLLVRQLVRGQQLHAALASMAEIQGALLHLRLGATDLAVASSPSAASQVFKSHDRALSGRLVPATYRVPAYSDHSLVWHGRCDEYWRSLRGLFRAELLSAQSVDGSATAREKKADDMVRFLLSRQGEEVQIYQDTFTAGTDTSTSLTEWTLSELVKNPKVMQEVRDELQRVLGDPEEGDNAVKESHLVHLPYLHACIKETLRLHPPAPLLLPRRAVETCQVMGYTIPEGCAVMVNAWAIGRNPAVWKDPMKFSPERFLDCPWDYKGGDSEFVPFGGGRRTCPGLSMATRMVRLVVASMVHNFDWFLADGMDPTDLCMDEKLGLVLERKQPLVLIPNSRMGE